mmetsp:Transcript_5823/g.12261  ORF Transcript_5823/g.12261 Transcript_5823/m.12261 type:complete len:206 (-) Transcript_5823:129-746(-)
MFTINTSPFPSFCTLAPFESPSVATPRSRRSRKKLISTSEKISGSVPTAPSTCPTSRSARVSVGSILVPTPMRPPGTAYCSSLPSAFIDRMTLIIGEHARVPDEFLNVIPGRTSIRSPTRSTPCVIDPPATPPLRSWTSSPGLLTSKLRITIMRGADVKSRIGMGTLLIKFSTTTSMLYLSCAEIGTTGAPSATVPCTKSRISWY